MKYAFYASLAAATLFAAQPAAATPTPTPTPSPANDPCTSAYVSGAIACQGYYGGNWFQGSAGDATPADIQAVIALLLNGTASTSDSTPTNNTSDYHPPYNLDYDTVLGAISNQTSGDSTFDFGPLTLSGLTIFGSHFGNNTDSTANNVSAFWLLNVDTPTSIVTVANGQGVSNAQIFATGGTSLPEPGTWALMLIGFGAVGVGMRRRRANKGALLQVA